jgi:putative oxidoreductase
LPPLCTGYTARRSCLVFLYRSRCHTFLRCFWQAGIIETLGGPLLLFGLFTRPVAFILSGEMAVAYFKFHAPQGFWPLLNDGEGVVLYCFMFLYFASTGGGAVEL